MSAAVAWAALAMASFAVAGGLCGFAAARRAGPWGALALCALLAGAALALRAAAQGAEGLRALAYGAAISSAALPALAGAAIGGAAGWWRRRGRHGA